MERAQAARALPFPFGRKRKQKGPFCTALRQREDRDTLKPVRRDAQKLAASRRSNNLCARFFTARGAMKKSPHEPRSQILRVLPRPSESFLSRRQLAVQAICVKPLFSHRNLLRKQVNRTTVHFSRLASVSVNADGSPTIHAKSSVPPFNPQHRHHTAILQSPRWRAKSPSGSAGFLPYLAPAGRSLQAAVPPCAFHRGCRTHSAC